MSVSVPFEDHTSTDDYAIRYASNWSMISLLCRQSTNKICCYPGCQCPNIEAHHVLYFDKEGAIAGREIPGVHVFGLCEVHHSKHDPDGAHNWRNWIADNKNPILRNTNTAKYYQKLRLGWLEKAKFRILPQNR